MIEADDAHGGYLIPIPWTMELFGDIPRKPSRWYLMRKWRALRCRYGHHRLFPYRDRMWCHDCHYHPPDDAIGTFIQSLLERE